jgi:hypothetical protein
VRLRLAELAEPNALNSMMTAEQRLSLAATMASST